MQKMHLGTRFASRSQSVIHGVLLRVAPRPLLRSLAGSCNSHFTDKETEAQKNDGLPRE